jgi:Erv1 / Alr family/Thioredoxin
VWTIAPVLLSLALFLATCTTAEYVAKYPFLYATEDDVNASFPVIEHLSPKYRGETDDKSVDDRPDFLYATTSGQTDTYRIVEYYIHYCNTCRLFVPVYRNFAVKLQELAALQNVTIDVYAVSCSPNRKLCVDQAIQGFPKIRLYKPSAFSSSGNSTSSDSSTSSSRSNTTEPLLLPYIELAHHTHLHPLTVLEQLGIDFDRPNGEDQVEEWDMESVVRASSLQSQSSPNTFAVTTLWQRAYAYWSGVPLSAHPPLQPSISQYQSHNRKRQTRDELRADIHLSFDYALRYEVYTTSAALSTEQQGILRTWLELLVRTLPTSWLLSKLIQELINNFVYIAQSEDYLVAVLDEFPSPTSQWSMSCSHGQADDGYTCGLWQLFHAMTVGVVDYNRAVFDTELLIVTETAARALKDYINTFLGCTVCRVHFVESYDNCDNERCFRLSDYAIDDEHDWMELPLWLSRTHNAVNVRLLYERAARESTVTLSLDDVQAVLWPPVRDCRACWINSTIHEDETETYDGATSASTTPTATTRTTLTWNEEMVYQYLRLEYGQRDARTAEFRRQLQVAAAEEQQQHQHTAFSEGTTTARHGMDSTLQPSLPVAVQSVLALVAVGLALCSWSYCKKARPVKKERID